MSITNDVDVDEVILKSEAFDYLTTQDRTHDDALRALDLAITIRVSSIPTGSEDD